MWDSRPQSRLLLPSGHVVGHPEVERADRGRHHGHHQKGASGERLGGHLPGVRVHSGGCPLPSLSHLPWPGQPEPRAGPWLLYQTLAGPRLLLTLCSGWSSVVLLDLCSLCNHFPAGGSRVKAESPFNSPSSHLASVPADQKASLLTARDSRDAPCCKKSPVQD